MVLPFFGASLQTFKHLKKGKNKIVVTIITILLFGILMPMIYKFFDIDMSKHGIYLYWFVALGFFYLLPNIDDVIII